MHYRLIKCNYLYLTLPLVAIIYIIVNHLLYLQLACFHALLLKACMLSFLYLDLRILLLFVKGKMKVIHTFWGKDWIQYSNSAHRPKL